MNCHKCGIHADDAKCYAFRKVDEGWMCVPDCEQAISQRCVYCGKAFTPDKNHSEHLCWENLASANQANETHLMERDRRIKQIESIVAALPDPSTIKTVETGPYQAGLIDAARTVRDCLEK